MQRSEQNTATTGLWNTQVHRLVIQILEFVMQRCVFVKFLEIRINFLLGPNTQHFLYICGLLYLSLSKQQKASKRIAIHPYTTWTFVSYSSRNCCAQSTTCEDVNIFHKDLHLYSKHV
jgi:hypothetical protein